MTVVDLNAWKEKQEWALQDAFFERQARSLGFSSFAHMEAADVADFELAMDRQQERCPHPDKHPDLGMCVDCMSALAW